MACAVAAGLASSRMVASDAWRDFIGWLSLFITTLGLGYTVYQVTLVKTAARAARKAAEQAREESRRQFSRFTAASLHRMVNETAACLERQEWGKAVLRLYDLADQAAQIGGEAEEWAGLVRNLRQAAKKCAALESGRRRDPTHEKWAELLMELRARLDTHFRPL